MGAILFQVLIWAFGLYVLHFVIKSAVSKGIDESEKVHQLEILINQIRDENRKNNNF
ncbi:hypothetical protein [Brevibacillus nitrificans]|uniref:hypothetical protein n=1 Tax=Brevibacillus nitrificans TaxID=651560 RepID=UPI0028638F8F|nr:hypothetical protein [Brevibacillus nitrificans]MDR7314673.1 hypothetical protein [Brevibacillus nitrificans]